MPFSNYPDGFKWGLTVRGIPILNTYAGNIWWVDSGIGSNGNSGKLPTQPFATIDYAIGRCTANNGDIILVAPGHTETITADSGIDVDVAGVTIIGLGNGEDRPTITFTTATAADLKMAAANTAIFNMVFKCNIASQDMMIEVSATDVEIANCDFREGSATGLNFISTAGAANACDRLWIHHNTFYAPTAGNYNSAIDLEEVNDSVRIEDNIIWGDFDDAGIQNPSGKVLTNLQIRRNSVTNLQSGQHAIQLVSACTGVAENNNLSTDAQSTAFDSGALRCSGNLWADSTADTEGVPVNKQADAATNFIGVDDSNNAASTSNVTANEDGSILERLEQLQEAINKGTGTALGSNRSLIDEIPGDPNYNRTNYFTVTADFSSAT
jgi:hypothetical protein